VELRFIRCESATLRTHWVLVVMDQFTRRIIGFGVHSGIVDGVALCGCSTCDSRAQSAQISQLRSRSAVSFPPMGGGSSDPRVTEIKSVPYVPLSHPFVERLIGTIRREYLDRILFWTTADLEAKLIDFQHYYNDHRPHTGLGGYRPEPPAGGAVSPTGPGSYRWRRHCRGLYQTPIAA
jgi:hypothetical protein